MTSNSGLSVIGYFCWWSVNDANISKEDLQKKIDEAGIDYAIPEVKQRTAFLKAIERCKGHEEAKGLLIRKISKGADAYVFGLVDEHVDKAAKDLRYNHTATMTFNQESGVLVCDQPHRAFELIQKLYQEYQSLFNADDIRDMLLKIIAGAYSISARQRGGIYFIPEAHKDLVEKLEKLLASIPGDNVFLVAPQIDTARTKKAIYKAFIEDLRCRIAKFEEDLSDDGLTRKSSIESRLEDFREMRKEIQFYSDALQFQATEISQSLDMLTEKVKAKLLA